MGIGKGPYPRAKVSLEGTGQMARNIFIGLMALIAFIIVGFLYVSGIISVLFLEIKMRSQSYYGPVVRDLALICSHIESEDETTQINSIWWPDSVRKLNPLWGYLGPDRAGVLFTCGFSHLSYKLEKVQDDSEHANRWELYFEDEGRRKYLATIDLSGDESFDFDTMYREAFGEYEIRLKENPDSAQLKQSRETIMSLFYRADDEIVHQ